MSLVDRIMFAIVLPIVSTVDALREWCASLEARLPPWAQDQDNRLVVYGIVACVVCVIAWMRL